jgi:hypothetical protein
MPTISMFYGILVLMFFRDNKPIFLCYPAGKAKPGDMLGG